MTPRDTINEAISNSEKFIAKCKGTKVENKYLAVFPDTMMAVKSEGGKAVFTEEPYSFEYAKVYCKSIINGHGLHPEIMEHREYLQKCIKQQEAHLAVLNELATKVN